MKRKKYSNEFKQQILDEYRLVSNVALVARRHEISKNTIYDYTAKS
ncbi:transposase [Anoxybacter fermentans]|nr:transposase [Anoxybacter fermentans]